MKALIQRVRRASVSVGDSVISEIGAGMLIFLGVARSDTEESARYLAGRIAALRIFEDPGGKMNLSLRDVSGSALVISQFTLCADTRKGNRPSFTDAAPPDAAEQLYGRFVRFLTDELGEEKVRTGAFRAMMDVTLVNDGPVTISVESKQGVQ